MVMVVEAPFPSPMQMYNLSFIIIMCDTRVVSDVLGELKGDRSV
jgi:hypothetical protein